MVREAERCSQKKGWGNKGGRVRETEGRRDRERTQKCFLEVVNSKSFKGLQLDWPSVELTIQLFANVFGCFKPSGVC